MSISSHQSKLAVGGNFRMVKMMYRKERKALIACEITAAGRAAEPSNRDGNLPRERNVARNATLATTIEKMVQILLRDLTANRPVIRNRTPNIAGIRAVLCVEPVKTNPATPKTKYAAPNTKNIAKIKSWYVSNSFKFGGRF